VAFRKVRDHEKKITVLDFDAVSEKTHHPKNELLRLCLVLVTKHMQFLPPSLHHLFLISLFSDFFFFCFNGAKCGSLNKEHWVLSNQ